MENINVYDINCSDYLASLGINIKDGLQANAPYRPEADSQSFFTNGVFFYDHARGMGGNVWQLALLMHNNDPVKASESLHKAAGVPFKESTTVELIRRNVAVGALERVRQAYMIGDKTPQRVLDYLHGRKIDPKCYTLIGYIPAGGVGAVLNTAEADFTGLENHEERIILWYLVGGKAAYYCSRDIATKEFRKGSLGDGTLSHPIWNIEDLYIKPKIIWAEGMFDCLSLMSLGYGVAGEITCHPIKKHLDDLVKALRYRQTHHPNWEFVICLDNDKPNANTGVGVGNAAAEKLAVYLLSNGLNVKWVKHDPSNTKTDINDLHQQGQEAEIHSMIAGAKLLSVHLMDHPDLLVRHYEVALKYNDVTQAVKTLPLITEARGLDDAKAVIKEVHSLRRGYREFYKGIELFTYNGIYYVKNEVYQRDRSRQFEEFRKEYLLDNIRKYQINPHYKVSLDMLDIPSKVPSYIFTKRQPKDTDRDGYLYVPSEWVRQKRVDNPILPAMWGKVLDNLAGPDEARWLLNHLAHWLQTEKKPSTIPVFVGSQGTGKTGWMSLFGRGVGGFIPIGRSELESGFNEYINFPVILLDELVSSHQEAKNIQAKLKSLINPTQSVNNKFKSLAVTHSNNYVAIASNERITSVPVIIEDDDRRYTIITGGQDKNLQHTEWFDYRQWEAEAREFIRYLLSIPIDEKMASTPLVNEKKREIAEMSEDPTIAVVREWVLQHKTDNKSVFVKASEIVADIKDEDRLKYPVRERVLKPIMKSLGYQPVIHNHQDVYYGLTFNDMPLQVLRQPSEAERMLEEYMTPSVGMN